jgi:hypothetical protein
MTWKRADRCWLSGRAANEAPLESTVRPKPMEAWRNDRRSTLRDIRSCPSFVCTEYGEAKHVIETVGGIGYRFSKAALEPRRREQR